MIFSKASGLNDSVYGKSQEPIKMFIEEEEQAYIKTSQIKNVFNVMDTDKFAEKFSYKTAKGDFSPVGEGGAYPRTSQQVGYEKVIEPDTWKSSFEVTEEMIEDATLFDVKSDAKDFMLAYTRTREKFGAAILNNANAASMTFNGKVYDISCADGQALFSTAHPSKTGGTSAQSNYFGNAFSYDALALVEEAMQKFTDDDGNLLNIQPDTIIVPNNARIKKLVTDSVYTTGDGQKPGTADAGFNFHGDRWNVIWWNQLANPAGITAGTDFWMVMDSKRNNIDGLIWLDRIPLSVRSWLDDNTGNNVFGGRARFAAAPVNWKVVAGVLPGVGTVLG